MGYTRILIPRGIPPRCVVKTTIGDRRSGRHLRTVKFRGGVCVRPSLFFRWKKVLY